MPQLDAEQCRLGIRALYTYLARRTEELEVKSKSSLFDDDEFIYLVLTLKKTPEKARNKPYRIPLQHSLYGSGGEICLFTKDPHSDYRAKLEANPVQGITKVIGISKLRAEYRQYQQRRELLQSYQLFMVDDRILPSMTHLVGTKFFDKKKQPVPVTISGKNIGLDLAQARDSTYLFIPAGPCVMVKIGRTSFSREQVFENITSAIQQIVEHIPKKWKNIQSLHIKTHDSTALPIFAALPQQTVIDTTVPAQPKKKGGKKSVQQDKASRLLKKTHAAPVTSTPASTSTATATATATTSQTKPKPKSKAQANKSAPITSTSDAAISATTPSALSSSNKKPAASASASSASSSSPAPTPASATKKRPAPAPAADSDATSSSAPVSKKQASKANGASSMKSKAATTSTSTPAKIARSMSSPSPAHSPKDKPSVTSNKKTSASAKKGKGKGQGKQ